MAEARGLVAPDAEAADLRPQVAQLKSTVQALEALATRGDRDLEAVRKLNGSWSARTPVLGRLSDARCSRQCTTGWQQPKNPEDTAPPLERLAGLGRTHRHRATWIETKSFAPAHPFA